MIDSKPRRWTARQMALVEQLGAAASAEIELRKRLSHAFLNDPVTGLPNREQFIASIEEVLPAARALTVVVIAIGISTLSSVRAGLGHDGARRMLVGIATRLKEGMPEALAARIDEDQFGLLGTASDERQALTWADEARELAVPIAEESGLIAPLGQLVLGEACRQAAEWRRAFPEQRLLMAVNVWPRQLQATDVSRLVGGRARGKRAARGPPGA